MDLTATTAPAASATNVCLFHQINRDQATTACVCKPPTSRRTSANMSETLQKIEFNVSLVISQFRRKHRWESAPPPPTTGFVFLVQCSSSSTASLAWAQFPPNARYPMRLEVPTPLSVRRPDPPPCGRQWHCHLHWGSLSEFVTALAPAKIWLSRPTSLSLLLHPSSHLLDFAMGANVCLRIVHFCNFFVIDWRVVSTIFSVFIEAPVWQNRMRL